MTTTKIFQLCSLSTTLPLRDKANLRVGDLIVVRSGKTANDRLLMLCSAGATFLFVDLNTGRRVGQCFLREPYADEVRVMLHIRTEYTILFVEGVEGTFRTVGIEGER